ncbi:MAG TPA: redoxin domain-containing protein [Verrucomicrobiota bacterium]|jgi:thiol-disulfide isomerase/thioredoxin|nr:redoxin domain-containing protein [Verrucomicrobiota bacterium]HQL79513.1 redoxin domain-containing protein [Verrucomicrobiota bacterium]
MNILAARKPVVMSLALLLALGAVEMSAPLPAGGSSKPRISVPAPELTGAPWLNLPPGTRLTLASRKGKVTIIHFWTYGCINCHRNLPIYDRWQKRYAAKGALVIGIHTPETAAESKLPNVVKKVKDLGITYPVLVDSNRQNWNRWQQRVWPAIYLVDKQGQVRHGWEGELEYKGAGGETRMSRLIEALLDE